MRNLKKILALVLAMVMTFSVMATANAFTDDKDVDATYEEAIEVLSGLKVFEGFEDGSFQPKGNITRAQVAAIIYRVVTGDVTNAQVGIYADYNKFTDVKSTAWYAGYVNYCANAEYIKGYGDGTFGPNDQVTGYQALAMILRAIGYDKNGEFTGSNWQVQTAAVGKKLGVTDNITAGTLGTAATREVVAEILFQTIANAKQVDYTLAFSYQSIGKNTLGFDTFGLDSETTQDDWGRPGVKWTATKPAAVKGTVATVYETAKKSYTTAVTECQVASDLGISSSKTYDYLWVNGNVSTNLTINALDTIDTIGAQGRLTEVYKDRIVMIDTFLAKVEAVTEAAYDAAGHLKTPSSIKLSVYDGFDASTRTATATTCYLTNGKTNYTYAVGDYILVNAHTNAGDRDGASTVKTTWAATTNPLASYMEIVGVAPSFEGTQSVIWYNANQHTVNGNNYLDAAEFNLDEALESTANFTWYQDQYGNLIGAVEIDTVYNYATIKNIWWNGDGSNGTGKAMATLQYFDGSENIVSLNKIQLSASANYLSITQAYDSTITSGTVTGYAMYADSSKLYVAPLANTNSTVDEAKTLCGNDDILNGHLFRVETLSTGSVNLSKVENELKTNVSVTTKYAWIVENGTRSVAVDAATKYLVAVRNSAGTYTYSTYTGMNEIPTFASVTAVDYVLGAGNVADYVYIVGTPVSSYAANFVLVSGNAYSAVLKTTGNISYWEVTLPVPAADGGATTLKFLDSDGKTNTVPASLTKMMSITNVGKLFYVNTVDGMIGEAESNVVEITNSVYQYDAVYAPNMRAILLNSATMPTGVDSKVVVGYIGSTELRVNVTDTTVISGTLAADMTNKSVYVLYDSTNINATKIWVVDKADTGASTTSAKVEVVGISELTATDGATRTTTATVTGYDIVKGSSRESKTNTGVTATVAWYLRNTTTGNYELFTGETFVAGTYKAVVTLNNNGAAMTSGEPAALAASIAVDYKSTPSQVLTATNGVFTVTGIPVS